jgi:hypothetical protein
VKVNWEHPLNRGLVAWWLLNEGSGLIAYDVVGRYPLTFNGTTPSWQHDGAYMNGTDNYLSASVVAPATPEFTLSFKFIRKGGTSSKGLLNWNTAYNSGYLRLLEIDYMWDDVFGISPDGLDFWYLGTACVQNTYYTVTVTLNGGTWRFYINGKYITQYDGANPPDNLARGTVLSFGAAFYGFSNVNFCYMYWLSRTLTDLDVLEIYNNPYGTPDNPRLI